MQGYVLQVFFLELTCHPVQMRGVAISLQVMQGSVARLKAAMWVRGSWTTHLCFVSLSPTGFLFGTVPS